MRIDTFQLFRYQILPTQRYQLDIFDGPTVDELIANKNVSFWRALGSIESEAHGAGSDDRTIIKTVYKTEDTDIAMLRIGKRKTVRIETKSFESEDKEHWPSSLVFVWNDPEQQLIAVQMRTSAFRKCSTVADKIVAKLNATLKPQGLVVIVHPILEKRKVWDMIREYKGRINKVRVQLVTPNMANISQALTDDLKRLGKETNATTSELTMSADEGANLHLEENDETMFANVANYAMEGGGKVDISINGLKKWVSTADSVKSVEVDSVAISGDAEAAIEAFKTMMK